MLYYHGSPYLFDTPDPTRSEGYYPTFFVTPHRHLAELFAKKLPNQDKAYLYTIEIEGDKTPYHEGALNRQFTQVDKLKIIRVEEVLFSTTESRSGPAGQKTLPATCQLST